MAQKGQSSVTIVHYVFLLSGIVLTLRFLGQFEKKSSVPDKKLLSEEEATERISKLSGGKFVRGGTNVSVVR